MGGEFKLGKTQVKLEKNQITRAKRKNTRVRHTGRGRCLIRIKTLIIWFSWKESTNDFAPVSLFFEGKGEKEIGERQWRGGVEGRKCSREGRRRNCDNSCKRKVSLDSL